MSDSSSAVYHCPSCGALAEVDTDLDDLAVCGKCGHEFKRPIRVAPRHSGPRAEGPGRFVQRDIVSRRRLVEHDQSVVLAELPPPPVNVDKIVPERGERPGEEVVLDDGHKKVIRRRKRKRKVNRRPYIFFALWLGLVVFAFLHLKKRAFRGSRSSSTSTVTDREIAEKAREAEVTAFLNQHISDCRRVLAGFLEGADAAERAQFVYEPVRVTPLMSSFIALNGLRKPSGALTLAKSGLIVRENFRAIETMWTAPDGEEFEVIFVRSNGAWRIDWEAFAAHSTSPWEFFVKGVGDMEGEFRLFMREKRSVTSPEDGSRNIGIKFYPPFYDVAKRHRGESPTVLVPASSPIGEQVDKVLSQRDRKRGWGDPSLEERDPKGLVRVRVVLEWRESGNGDKHLHLKDLKAGNWLATGLGESVVRGEVEEAGGDDEKQIGGDEAEEAGGDEAKEAGGGDESEDG